MSSEDGGSGTPQLVIVSGPLAGSVVDVGERLSLGRRPENLLRLKDEQASRFHAVIEERDGRWVIEDLGSTSGTFVNGRAVGTVTALENGSEIVIGQTVLRFELPRPPPPPRGASRGPLPVRSTSLVTLVPVGETPFRENLAKDTTTELRRAGEHLQTLLTANSIISSELDLHKLFDKILDQIWGTFPAHRAVIMTKRAEHEPLRVVASRTIAGAEVDPELVSQSIVDRAFTERVGVLTVDAGADSRFDPRQSILDLGIRSAICVPMVHHDTVLGVIYLDTVGITHAFQEDDLRLLTGIAGPAGGAVRNALLVQKLRTTAVDTILRLAVAAEYRDDDTGFHIHRMSDYAEAIAHAMGLSASFSETLKLASPMHDVGKIGIADAILKKPGRLTKEEFEEMKLHTVKGGAILSSSDSDLLAMAEQIALTHHEKFDGSGYPRGLARDDIPLEGRIVAVADVFDALTNRRCYKPPYSVDQAFRHIEAGAGAHFDPEIVSAFLRIEGRILAIREHYLTLAAREAEEGAPSMPRILKRRSF